MATKRPRRALVAAKQEVAEVSSKLPAVEKTKDEPLMMPLEVGALPAPFMFLDDELLEILHRDLLFAR
jgi:hypothetical protein